MLCYQAKDMLAFSNLSVETFCPSSPTAAACEMWTQRFRLVEMVCLGNYSIVYVHCAGWLTCMDRWKVASPLNTILA